MLENEFTIPPGPAPAPISLHIPSGGIDFYGLMTQIEVHLIQQALVITNGNRTYAASLLGLKRPCLAMKIKKLGLMG